MHRGCLFFLGSPSQCAKNASRLLGEKKRRWEGGSEREVKLAERKKRDKRRMGAGEREHM